MRSRNGLVCLMLVCALALSGWVSTAIGGTAKPAPRSGSGKLAVGVTVLHFSAAGRTVTATGTVTARLTDSSGHVSTVRQKVALTAATGGTCRVLHLRLDKLSLKLLGLNADLDRVLLDITGQRKGGVLGALFCRLASAKVSSAARSSALRAMNRQVSGGHGKALRFSARLAPQATASAANSTCQVLDLVVGPLNLNLLGLVVDLQRVHLSVTATRGQGKLGDLFCQLADNNTSGTTGASGATGTT
jgi:hypothetical protein